MKIYRYSHYTPNASGHGGEKRSYQIVSFFQQLGCDVVDYQPTISLPRTRNKIKSFYELIKFYLFLKRKQIIISSISRLKAIKHSYNLHSYNIKQIPHKTTFVYEHGISLDWIFVFVAKNAGHNVICIPHNLETLVSGQKSPFSNICAPNCFFEEISLFQASDLVLAISKEEQLFLGIFKINALYFPYDLGPIERKSLQEIKLRRSTSASNRYLILGSYDNPPTKAGVGILCSELCKPIYASFCFLFAGFGMEKLNNDFTLTNNIQVLGAVSVSELYELYASVSGVIIYQTPTTGALTKVPELLSAGVPLLMNRFAARNYNNLSGVYVYDDIIELYSCIVKCNSMSDDIDFNVDTDYSSVINNINLLVR